MRVVQPEQAVLQQRLQGDNGQGRAGTQSPGLRGVCSTIPSKGLQLQPRDPTATGKFNLGEIFTGNKAEHPY